MKDDIDARQQRCDRLTVANVDIVEVDRPDDPGEVRLLAGEQIVYNNDALDAGFGKQAPDQSRSDEPSPAGDQDFFHTA